MSKFETFTVEEKLNFPLVTLNRDDFSCIDFSLIKQNLKHSYVAKSDRSSNSVSKLSSSYNGSSSKKVRNGKVTGMSIANSTTVSQKSDLNIKKRDTISMFSGKMTTNSEEFIFDPHKQFYNTQTTYSYEPRSYYCRPIIESYERS